MMFDVQAARRQSTTCGYCSR